ncbi:Chemotaxis protein methyltransferase CheR [hydrothermal vent metagenome]|uniref:protein-glutamate O-methyltransferase n=1 Tax=hydrothermal vent metagenome TaxID=652676 RepID=A0A3B0W3I4_9ZZZZ
MNQYATDGLIFFPDFKLFDYKKWSTMLEKRVGITIPKERESFLQTKIWSRMRELGVESFSQYWEIINNGITGKLEWTELLDRLTVHETSFFRHKPSYNLVANDFSKILIQNKKFHYKVWSVSCATGEEPYSLAMLMHSLKSKSRKDNIYYGVTATDVSKPALSIGTNAYYCNDKLKEIERSYRGYVNNVNNNIFTIESKIKQRVAFGVFNLLKINAMPAIKFDIIFCQNVLIYFSKEKKIEILEGFKRFLKIGGMLILNPTDIGSWKSNGMTRITYKRTLAYKLD